MSISCQQTFEQWWDKFGSKTDPQSILPHLDEKINSAMCEASWAAWQAAWLKMSVEATQVLRASDALIRHIRHRDARWHDDAMVIQVLADIRSIVGGQLNDE